MKNKANKNDPYTTADKVSTYETTVPLLQAMYDEFKEISKKKPDSAVSENKIKIANRLLEKVRVVLGEEETIAFLDLLDDENVPQASDVTLMLSQYVAAMKAFHDKYWGHDGSKYGWFIK